MIVAYTDGACLGNPGPGGWAAVLVQDGARQEISGGAPHTTNNRMELTAVIEALRRVPAATPVRVVTDSQYVMRGITSWVAGWRKRGWRTATGQPVLNRDLWEELSALAGAHVTWDWVRGHSGHPENERADTLARTQARAQARTPGGSAPRPGIAAPPPVGRSAERPSASRGPARSSRGGASGRGATYLSLVDGRLMRHADWPSCQARVHRQPAARFKKCSSAAEEQATVARWGLSPALLASLDQPPS